ncbi:MAG: hypothetical protein HYZ71_09905, partial [Deltaproteobacteria bacterium]|nr:hypothetical protein [Deltaproteobacteria bacterium]
MRFIASLVTSIFTMILIGGCTGGGGGNDVVAEYNGKKVTASEAFAQVKTRLFDLEEEMYRTKEQAINDFVEQRLLDGEAKKQKLSIDALVEKEAGGDVGDVADKDVEEFLTSKGLSLKDPRVRKDDV